MALGKNIIDVILRLVDQLSPGYRKAAKTVQEGSQQMAGGHQQASKASDQAAASLDRVKDKSKEAGDQHRKHAKDAHELQMGYMILAGAMTVAYVGMTRAIAQSVAAHTREVAAFTGLRSIVIGTGKDYDKARQFVQSFTEDGLIAQTKAAEALKNLLQRGFTLDQAIDMLHRFKDAAAFGRQASLDMGQAVASATEGIKNENSILVDNAGITKNVSQMWKEYAQQIGKGVNSLTLAEKRTAEYNGIMQESRHQVGDAAKLAGQLGGELSKAGQATERAAAALGKAWAPAVFLGAKLLTGFMNTVREVAERFPGLTFAVSAAVMAVTAMTAVFVGWMAIKTPVVAAMTAITVKATAMWAAITGPVGFVIAGIAAVGAALYYLSTQEQRAAEAALKRARAVEDAAKQSADAARNRVREIVAQEQQLQDHMTSLQEQAARQREEIARQERERRRQEANKFGELLISALRQRYEEQQEVEEQALEDQTTEQREALDKQYQQAKDHYDKELDAARDQADRMKDLARQKADDQLDELQRWADEQERILRKARNEELAALDEEVAAEIRAREEQIDSIDNATREEERQEREHRRQQRIAELEAKAATLTDAEEIARVRQQIADLVAEGEREALLRTREAQKAALREEIEEIRRTAEERRTTIEEQYQSELDKLRETVEAKKSLIEQEKEQAITAAGETLAARKQALDEGLAAEKASHEQGMAELQARTEAEKAEIKAKYEALTHEANLYAEALKLVQENNQQEILALLDQYEPDWQQQGKDFVERLAQGGEEAKPAVDALAEAIGITMQAAAENVQYLRDTAGDGAEELGKINAQLGEAQQKLSELQATRYRAEMEALATMRAAESAKQAREEAEENLKAIEERQSQYGGSLPYPGGASPGGQTHTDYYSPGGSRHGGGLVPFSGAYRLLEGERVLSRAETERYERVTRLVDASTVMAGAAGWPSPAPAGAGAGGMPPVVFDFRGSTIRDEQDAEALMRRASQQFLGLIRQNSTPAR